MSVEREVVWLVHRRHYAFLVYMGAYFSEIEFTREGITHRLEIENDEYELWQERAIDYESGE